MSLDFHRTVGVLGAGTMGAGIAQVAAAAGHPVVLADSFAGAVDRARQGHQKAIGREVEKGRLSQDAAAGLLGRISYRTPPSGDLSDLAGSALVIEAIVEDLAIKRAVFQELDRVVDAEAILATNTSSLSVSAIAGACAKPGRVIGIHFFNPAPILPLVEIVPALTTDPAVTASARATPTSASPAATMLAPARRMAAASRRCAQRASSRQSIIAASPLR